MGGGGIFLLGVLGSVEINGIKISTNILIANF